MKEIAQMRKMDADDNRYNCSIENYIMDEYSICREERQYAVFLYNILRKYGKRKFREKLTGKEKKDIPAIFKACGIEADSDIEYVFYEAAFMRDFFKRERRYYAVTGSGKVATALLQQSYEKEKKTKTDFNRRLIEYVFHTWEGKDPPEMDMADDQEKDAYLQYNLGGNIPKECADLGKIEEVREKVRAMMNSKPDIAVIYKKGGQRYLLFIECKFESYEDTVECEKSLLSQRMVQYHIAEFICGYLNERNGQEYINVSEQMKSGQSRMVRFRRSDSGRQGPYLPEDGNILIKLLTEYNDKIFDDL